MSKTIGGDRKRTVTIVIGPKTGRVLDAVIAFNAQQCPGFRCSWTDVAGVAFDYGLGQLAGGRGIIKDGTTVNHGE